jgi:hypothetical protein
LIGFVRFHAFIYLVFLFYSIFLFFGFWCSLFRWFYNFVVPKLFSSNVLIVVFTSFIFLFILMLYNIRLIRLDIFFVHCTGLRLILYKRGAEGLLLKCVSKYESLQILAEIHEGICGAHQSGIKMRWLIHRYGYFWPSVLKIA